MNIDKAIVYCREIAERDKSQGFGTSDHEQLAQWLEEVKKLRASNKVLKDRLREIIDVHYDTYSRSPEGVRYLKTIKQNIKEN